MTKKKNLFISSLKKIRQFWNYVWNGNDIWSWILSIIFAFIIIKFLFYPALGLMLSTSHPVVAIVSGSMEHKISDHDNIVPTLCGNQFTQQQSISYEKYWENCGEWYEERGINRQEFKDFPFSNGMNIGDIIFLRNPGAENIEVGDIIVFIQDKNPAQEPIIHRVVDIQKINGEVIFQTKGDHNKDSINISSPQKYLNEYEVKEEELVGKAIARIPFIGYLKIVAYDMMIKIRGLIT